MERRWLVVLYFFVFSVISGAIYSQLITVLGVSVVEIFSIDNRQVATLYLTISILSFVVTLVSGYLSDLYGFRWLMVCVALTCGAVATYLVGEAKTYESFFWVFVPLFSLVYLCTPQLMAIYRSMLNCMPNSGSIALYNAIVRCGFALAWIVGPPAGFYLKDRIGPSELFRTFSLLYLVAAAYSLLGAFCFRRSPGSSTKGLLSNMISSRNQGERINVRGILALFIAFSLAYSINHGYLISFPLYISAVSPEMGVLIGIVFGVAAAVEIPFMELNSGVRSAPADKRKA